MKKILTSIIVLMILATANGQIYVRYCYSDFQTVLAGYSPIRGKPLNETIANLKLSFFSDATGTIPYNFTGGQVKIIIGSGGPAGDPSYHPYYASSVNAYSNCGAHLSSPYTTVTGNVVDLGVVITTQDMAYEDGMGNEWIINEKNFIAYCSPSNLITVGNGTCNPCTAPAAPSVSSSTYKLCSGQSATLSANGSGTINWYLNGEYYSSGASVSTSSPGTYYSVSVTACGSSGNSSSINIASGNRLPTSGPLTFSQINTALGRTANATNTNLSTLIWASDATVPKSVPHKISYFYNYCY